VSAYFDTSALLKLVLDEDDSQVARDAWDAFPRPVASRLVYPEACAGLALATRTGRLPAGSDEARNAIDTVYEELEVLDLSEELAHDAGALARSRGLTGADAIHLASALVALEIDGVLVTWDRALARAARAEGLIAIP
jgi:predicted nucleic acid-binding protein